MLHCLASSTLMETFHSRVRWGQQPVPGPTLGRFSPILRIIRNCSTVTCIITEGDQFV
uniref:Uncharacterized protein n=1 Tax=Aegilops tauschii subsp. strangulata TaxID=200361 RepID=A0A452ZLB7_AEGTS